jgi:hypothetical protein
MKFAFLLILLAEDSLPNLPGKSTYMMICSECHGADSVTSMGHNRAGWKDIVDDMVDKGATATPKQAKEIINYLAKAFPKKPAK